MISRDDGITNVPSNTEKYITNNSVWLTQQNVGIEISLKSPNNTIVPSSVCLLKKYNLIKSHYITCFKATLSIFSAFERHRNKLLSIRVPIICNYFSELVIHNCFKAFQASFLFFHCSKSLEHTSCALNHAICRNF
mmetsp:Transcript_14494/g.16705  ORF Transcript_14494/g.16705 Transcript_14494/m.16705 type:complete len:136 (+) Transcript_14494:879-1286(+)